LIPVIISIFLCYTLTKSQGRSFLIRWWLFMLATSAFDTALIFVFLLSKTFVSGSVDLPVYWKIPTFMIASRAIVGLLQSMLYYYLFSILIVKILGGLFSFAKFRMNLAYPYPKMIRP